MSRGEKKSESARIEQLKEMPIPQELQQMELGTPLNPDGSL